MVMKKARPKKAKRKMVVVAGVAIAAVAAKAADAAMRPKRAMKPVPSV
jgi:hypothetical protein